MIDLKDINVLDEFIPESLVNDLELLVNGDSFPWYYEQTTYKLNSFEQNDTPQLVHNLWWENIEPSYAWNTVGSLLYFLEYKTKIQVSSLDRAKINLLLKNTVDDIDMHHPMHVDNYDSNAWTLLYYPSDSDGDTVFEKDNIRIQPKKGRAVLFKSSLKHASSSPKFNKKRIAINIVFLAR
jgi:hypothetical protein